MLTGSAVSRLREIAKSEREIYVFRLSAIRAAPYGLVLQKTTRQLVFEDIHEGLQSEIVFEDNEAACAALAKETANVDVALVLPWRSRSIVARHDQGCFPPMGPTRRTLRPEAGGASFDLRLMEISQNYVFSSSALQ